MSYLSILWNPILVAVSSKSPIIDENNDMASSSLSGIILTHLLPFNQVKKQNKNATSMFGLLPRPFRNENQAHNNNNNHCRKNINEGIARGHVTCQVSNAPVHHHHHPANLKAISLQEMKTGSIPSKYFFISTTPLQYIIRLKMKIIILIVIMKELKKITD